MAIKKRLLKRISFSNRISFTILSIAAVILLATIVYATAELPGTSGGWDSGEVPNAGHTIQDIGAPSGCIVGQYLQYQHGQASDAGYWICVNPAGISTPSPCTSGQVLTYTGSSWNCTSVSAGGTGFPAVWDNDNDVYIDTAYGGNDCYDTSNSVHPGTTWWFSTHRGDGSFDYDCDGVITYQLPVATAGQCATAGGALRVGDSEYSNGG